MIEEPLRMWVCACVFLYQMTAKPTSKPAAAQFIYFEDGLWKSLMLPLICHCVEEELANFFFVKGQLVNILDFVDHMVSSQ